MKKISKVLAALAICGALSFGLTNDAQAAELESSSALDGVEVQDLYRPPPPPPPRHGHRPPPPPYDDDWGYGSPPPPPPPRHGHRPPPPPPHGW